MSQTECFQKEINNLAKGKSLKNSKLVSLNPFVDSDGILRVGGRLNNSQFPFEKKHPCILSSQSHLAQLIVRHAHLCLLHAGPQHTLATIREEYWIVGGRILVKQIVRKCIPCFRYRPKLAKPIMAPLPEMQEVYYMGPLIDAELEKVDRKHAQLTQLSADLVEALSLYHTLMREPQFTTVNKLAFDYTLSSTTTGWADTTF
ncbi:hypothetical protein NQ317_004185 [Molorchus minor]|uniref:Integrase zinc-binding domain-containing protein n=1 Tax=Molorchus minor TaxID=1323400 RepID=A0ABQ9JC22_9CUCU|nr:hypothetical protein NQ317_004185 [Molorchus minor]